MTNVTMEHTVAKSPPHTLIYYFGSIHLSSMGIVCYLSELLFLHLSSCLVFK